MKGYYDAISDYRSHHGNYLPVSWYMLTRIHFDSGRRQVEDILNSESVVTPFAKEGRQTRNTTPFHIITVNLGDNASRLLQLTETKYATS